MSLVSTAAKLIDRFGVTSTLSRPSASVDPITGIASTSSTSRKVTIVPINDQELLSRSFGVQGRSIGFYVDAIEIAVGDTLTFNGDTLSVVEVAPTYLKDDVVYYVVRVES